MKSFIFLTLFAMLTTPFCSAGGIDAFIGSWQVDYKATLASVKKSPKYNPEKDAVMMPKILRKIADRMVLEITDKKVTFNMGEGSNAMPYTVKSDANGTVVLAGKMMETKVLLTLQPRKKGRMNLKSSMTDDMDYYIWQPAKKDKGQEK